MKVNKRGGKENKLANGSHNGKYITITPTRYSEEMNEMLSRPAGWINNRGIVLIAGILITAIIASSFISMPDTIACKVKLATDPSPAKLNFLKGGKIKKIYATEGSVLKAGDIVAELETNISYADILLLDSITQKVTYGLAHDIPSLKNIADAEIDFPGEIQISYSNLITDIRKIFDKDYNASHIMEEEDHHHHEDNNKTSMVKRDIIMLTNYIRNWKNYNLLSAPYQGTVVYLASVYPNKLVSPNEELFAILPAEYHYTGSINIPVRSFDKVYAGQEVIIDLDNFPAKDYGNIKGKIKKINTIAEIHDGIPQSYTAFIYFSDTLLTMDNKVLPFLPEMGGTAKIVTKNTSIFSKMLSSTMNR